jgi:Major Facilitator Superfamily
MNLKDYPHYKTTQYRELLRIIFASPARAMASGGIILMIALKFFEATPTIKALLLMSPFFGLLLTPLLVQVIAKLKFPASKVTGTLLLLSSVGFLAAGLTNNYWIFIISIMLARPFSMMIPPTVTALWRQNVPPQVMGTKFSNVNWIGIVSSLTVGVIFFLWFKSQGIDGYPLILIIVSIGLFLSGLTSLRTPSVAIESPGRIPYSSLFHIWKDPLFGYVCLAWSIMGIAQIATIPLRIEYVASGVYGMKYSPAMVLLLMQLIPQSMMLLTMPFWGRLFDKHNFILIRIAHHFILFLSIALFFIPSFFWQVVASFLFGITMGGGMISWNLWVTKFAKKEKTAEYMSAHTCLCGIRGILAPTITYYFLADVGVITIARIGAGLMLLSALMLIPIIKLGHRRTVVKAQACS